MKKQLIDQSAHFITAIVILLSVFLLGAEIPIVASAILGFSFGMIREITEKDPVLSQGSLVDILFWTLGGLTAGIVL